MTTRLLVAPLVAIVTLAHAPAGGVARADDTRSTAAAPTTLRIRGIVEKYEAATRMLSLMTAAGVLRIQLAPAVRIRHGWSEINADELAKLAGYRAAVRYSQLGGNKTAESIHVFGKTERTDR